MNQLTAEHIVKKAITTNPALSDDALLTYLRDLLRWNPQLGLVSRRDPLAACERLILESLELLALMKERGCGAGLRCLDVGSGGGFPGLVWALAEPGWTFLLVERKVGRSAFLQAEVLRLGLAGVEVFAGPVEDAARHARFESAFEIAVAMAVGSADEIGAGVEWMLAAGGRFAGTLSSGAVAPGRLGKSLALELQQSGNFGNYTVYVKTAS